jgi:hypothetical protein
MPRGIGYFGGNSLPPINAAIPGFGDPVRHVNKLQTLQANKLQIDEAPKRFKREAERHTQATAKNTQATEKHGWAKEDRTIAAEFKALAAASSAKSSEDALAIYNRTRPKGAKAAGLGQAKPTFSRQGGSIIINGGPGTYTLKGPEGAVSAVLEEVSKNPQIIKDPEQFQLLMKVAAENGVSLTPNAKAEVTTPGKWEPTSKAETLEIIAAKKTPKAGDDPTKTIAKHRKEVARLATVRQRIRKGDAIDQVIKLMDKDAREAMGVGEDTTIVEAIAKIDDYEKWLRKQIRELESGGSGGGTDDNPAGLTFRK